MCWEFEDLYSGCFDLVWFDLMDKMKETGVEFCSDVDFREKFFEMLTAYHKLGFIRPVGEKGSWKEIDKKKGVHRCILCNRGFESNENLDAHYERKYEGLLVKLKNVENIREIREKYQK